mmetsp:Transcript_2657/g.5568  ORF Transcript_2657/g.5568 Transcript_2657/m.5568 type:complete len:778 (+) Transcript_2657:442-2775(+)
MKSAVQARSQLAASAAEVIPFCCIVCFEEFNTTNRPPMVLPCGHTYVCQQCTKRLKRCMECRQSLFLPPSSNQEHNNNHLHPPHLAVGSSRTTRFNPNHPSTQQQQKTNNNPIPLPIPKNLVLLAMMEAAVRQGLQSNDPKEEREEIENKNTPASPTSIIDGDDGDSSSEEEEEEEEEEEDDDEDEYEDDDYEDGEEDDEDGSEESPEAADPDPLTDHLREEKAKAPKRDNELDPPSLPLEVDMNESQSPDSSLEDGTDGKKPGWFGRGGRNKKQKENTSLLESHGESSSHGSPKESQPSGGQEKKGGFFSGWGFGRKNKQKQEEEKSADYEDDEVSEEEAEPLFEAMFDNDAPVSPGGDSRLEEMFVTQKNGDGQGKRKVAASHGKNSADSLDGVSDEVDEAIFAEDDDRYQDEYDQRRHGEVEHDRGPPGFERKPSRKQKKKKKKKGGDAPMMVSGLKDDEFEDEVMDQSADDSEHLRERMALHATKQSKAERGARSRVGGSFDDDDDYEFVKKNDAIYDEELGMPPRSRVTMTDAVYREDEGLIRDNRNRVYCMLLICCCLCIMMIGASFGAAYFAIELFEDDDEAITAAPVAPRTINITTAPTTSPPTTAPTVPSPTSAPIIPDAVANNTPRCPNGNVPLEIVVTFDGEPEEVGLQLRDSSQVAVWGFATGTFRSFSQFLRENYFMVCVSPVVTYQLEVTDSEGTGLISELIGQPVYGKFSIFYNEALVSRYNGDCASTEEGITDCGPFCSCEFILSEGLADGGCTNQCSSNQ